MVNVIELRKYIKTQLKTVCDNVFYEKALNNCLFPYTVFEIDITFIDDKDMVQLEINIFDNNNDSTNIELLTNDIERLFNREKHNDEFHSFAIFKNVRNNVDSEKDNIKRRRLLFDLNYYGSEV